MQALLEDNLKQKELREKRNREKEQKEIARREALSVKKEQLMKTKGCASALLLRSYHTRPLHSEPAHVSQSTKLCHCVREAQLGSPLSRMVDSELTCVIHAYRYQRLLAQEYDRKLKEAKRKGKIRFNVHETVDGQTIDVHTSQSSLLGRETSTPSVSTSGFNYNDFVAETGQSGASGVYFSPE